MPGPAGVRMADLSVLVVNYNSTDFLLGLVDSLENQEFILGGRKGSKEILVVDNHSREEERGKLRALEGREGVRIFELQENLGYGGGNNRAFAEAKGDLILVVNPDILLLPGALDRMVSYLLEHPGVAAVGPRCWMDRDRTVLHPPNRYPTLCRYILQSFAHRFTTLGRLSSYLRSRYSVPIWRARKSRPLEMLSGACFLTRRRLIEEIGFFDEKFPLYFEDTDLFRRMRRKGYRVVFLPEAEIIHFYNRSAVQDYPSAMKRFKASEEHYYRKYYGKWGYALYSRIDRWVRSYVSTHEPLSLGEMEFLGVLHENPEFWLSENRGEFCVEIAGNALFTLAAAAFGKGKNFRLSKSMWEQLDAGFYFVRILALPSRKALKMWSFQKG